MGTSKRYAEYYDRQAADRLAEAPPAPCTLPQQAYGPNPITWTKKRPPVWAWITWPDQPAERIPAFATGWNDRVVIVEWNTTRGTRKYRRLAKRRHPPTRPITLALADGV